MAQLPNWFQYIKDVQDWPKPGIVFKDITPLLASPAGFEAVIDDLAARVAPLRPTQVVGVESRGFIFGAAVARALGVGLTLVRKPGKLPRTTRHIAYDLEYGQDALEMHVDALGPADSAVVVDDVLATGGTAAAVAELVASTGASLAALAFVMELGFLGGRAKLPAGTRVESLAVL
jgi:adenine phosphoribosyltransferase